MVEVVRFELTSSPVPKTGGVTKLPNTSKLKDPNISVGQGQIQLTYFGGLSSELDFDDAIIIITPVQNLVYVIEDKSPSSAFIYTDYNSRYKL